MDYFELREALASRIADKPAPVSTGEVAVAETPEPKPQHIKHQENELYYLDEDIVNISEALKKSLKLREKRELKKKKAKIVINPQKEEL